MALYYISALFCSGCERQMYTFLFVAVFTTAILNTAHIFHNAPILSHTLAPSVHISNRCGKLIPVLGMEV
jgi:hypothetical protein